MHITLHRSRLLWLLIATAILLAAMLIVAYATRTLPLVPPHSMITLPAIRVRWP